MPRYRERQKANRVLQHAIKSHGYTPVVAFDIDTKEPFVAYNRNRKSTSPKPSTKVQHFDEVQTAMVRQVRQSKRGTTLGLLVKCSPLPVDRAIANIRSLRGVVSVRRTAIDVIEKIYLRHLDAKDGAASPAKRSFMPELDDLARLERSGMQRPGALKVATASARLVR